VSFAEGKPPPIALQWYRGRAGEPFERIPGATALTYMPTADDVNFQVGVACLPCSGQQPLGVSHFQVNPPVQLDPDLAAIYKGLVANGYAEFRVRLLKETQHEVMFFTLILRLEGLSLKDGLRTRLEDVYRPTFKVRRRPGQTHHLPDGVSERSAGGILLMTDNIWLLLLAKTHPAEFTGELVRFLSPWPQESTMWLVPSPGRSKPEIETSWRSSLDSCAILTAPLFTTTGVG
jgi:hypothetical protein